MTNRLLKLEKQNCNPCQMVQNYLDANNVTVEKVDVFDSPHIAVQHDIASVPVVLLLNSDGIEIARSTGFKPDELENLIKQL